MALGNCQFLSYVLIRLITIDSLSLYATLTQIYMFFGGGCPCGIMDCGIVVSEFKLQLCYYSHFWTNTLGKGMNPLILPAMG